MDYAQKVAADITKYLQKLREQIDEDISGIEGLVPSLTLEEADYFGERVGQLTVIYRQAMAPLYRGRPRNHSTRERLTGRAQSRTGGRSGIEQAALEAIEKQGYVREIDLQALGYNRNAISRRMRALAAEYNWDSERHPEGGWVYARRIESQPEEQTDVSVIPLAAEATGQRRRQRRSESTEPPETEPEPSEAVVFSRPNDSDTEPSEAT